MWKQELKFKAQPASVANEIKHTFKLSKWETEKQIRNFFNSQAAIQKKKNVNEDIDDDDINACIAEKQ